MKNIPPTKPTSSNSDSSSPASSLVLPQELLLLILDLLVHPSSSTPTSHDHPPSSSVQPPPPPLRRWSTTNWHPHPRVSDNSADDDGNTGEKKDYYSHAKAHLAWFATLAFVSRAWYAAVRATSLQAGSGNLASGSGSGSGSRRSVLVLGGRGEVGELLCRRRRPRELLDGTRALVFDERGKQDVRVVGSTSLSTLWSALVKVETVYFKDLVFVQSLGEMLGLVDHLYSRLRSVHLVVRDVRFDDLARLIQCAPVLEDLTIVNHSSSTAAPLPRLQDAHSNLKPSTSLRTLQLNSSHYHCPETLLLPLLHLCPKIQTLNLKFGNICRSNTTVIPDVLSLVPRPTSSNVRSLSLFLEPDESQFQLSSEILSPPFMESITTPLVQDFTRLHHLALSVLATPSLFKALAAARHATLTTIETHARATRCGYDPRGLLGISPWDDIGDMVDGFPSYGAVVDGEKSWTVTLFVDQCARSSGGGGGGREEERAVAKARERGHVLRFRNFEEMHVSAQPWHWERS
ncbi:hypothetical protein T439DRAFT_379413 [Meredithblackwellia eburnea MCA 4105]